jgi:type I restriction enzyme R subunit
LLRQLGSLPKPRLAPLEQRLHAASAKIRQLRGWQHWGNQLERENLCKEMEALIGLAADPEEIARQVRAAQAEWKRLSENDVGNVAAEVLLNGMLAKDRLLDILENFILFDASKAGHTRKVVARNHQLLGVNQAVASVLRQEALKREFPTDQRLTHRTIELPKANLSPAANEAEQPYPLAAEPTPQYLQIIERAHPDLGRLGVVWHTQGSGKSYSMAFFAEKVRRTVPGNFTFVFMTDRDDLDSQIYKTFIGCGVADEQTPRASSGRELQRLLAENHRFVFSLIHKFNQEVKPDAPYSERDDIIVVSDEEHRTQSV